MTDTPVAGQRTPDPFELDRFVAAQDAGASYASAVQELRAGYKSSHWMWFVFPQVAGLGRSAMAQRYAISGRAEAAAYLAHPVLGPRLRDCAAILIDLLGRNAVQILGGIDAQKLQSCMTLFHLVAPDETLFSEVLERYYAGELDQATLRLL